MKLTKDMTTQERVDLQNKLKEAVLTNAPEDLKYILVLGNAETCLGISSNFPAMLVPYYLEFAADETAKLLIQQAEMN